MIIHLVAIILSNLAGFARLVDIINMCLKRQMA